MTQTKDSFWKILIRLLIIFVCSVAAGYLLLVAVYMLPTKRIDDNVAKSAHIMQEEDAVRCLVHGNLSTAQDNVTDSLMLLIAAHPEDEPAFVEAVKNELDAYSFNLGNTARGLAEKYLGNAPDEGSIAYSRYWHGYLILLKPLLLIMSYGKIRFLIGFAQLALVMCIVGILCYKKQPLMAVPVVLVYLFMNPAVLSLSMQYNSIFTITFAELLLIAVNEKFYENPTNWIYHFFVTGIAVAYFDLLTYPLVAFGVPFIFLIARYGKKNGRNFLQLIKSGLSWVIGYALMWAGKWLLADIITGQGTIKAALGQVMHRISGSSEVTGESLPYLKLAATAIGRNLELVKVWLVIGAVLAVCGLVLVIIKRKGLFSAICIWILGLMPFAWYAVLANHSSIHMLFTYRNMAITIFALAMVIAKTASIKNENRRVK